MEISTFLFVSQRCSESNRRLVMCMKINCSLNTFISPKFDHPLLYFHLLKYLIFFFFQNARLECVSPKSHVIKAHIVQNIFNKSLSLSSKLHCTQNDKNRIFIHSWHTVIFIIFVTIISLKLPRYLNLFVCMLRRIHIYPLKAASAGCPTEHFSVKGSGLNSI